MADRELVIQALLETLLAEAGDEAWAEAAHMAGIPPFDDDGDPVRSVGSFESEGLLTRDAGVVLRLADGSEYQLTIVCSRSPN